MDQLDAWSEFNVAMVGATAALAGLVIVASSVNIVEIIKSSTLTARLAAAIAALVLAIVVAGLGLMPGIGTLWYGIAIAAATMVAGAFQVHATITIVRDPVPEHTGRFLKSALGFAPVLAYTAAAALLVLGAPGGLVIAAVAALLAIVSAIVVSWVALVEVLR
ncbi:hypothetical protein ASD56_12590 [Microbacterium sp. Root166]|uniref:hypothetical protein n=1 Tax=Microbacterium sp. Root166 TaxID=1736478 RepID=UPI0006F1D1C4|nr:hypothetical protein [Microbacterium sp. Root166]KQZ83158.1 hypothetical protein ASD56_12590 [Microbacterium sp. Root166]